MITTIATTTIRSIIRSTTTIRLITRTDILRRDTPMGTTITMRTTAPDTTITATRTTTDASRPVRSRLIAPAETTRTMDWLRFRGGLQMQRVRISQTLAV